MKSLEGTSQLILIHLIDTANFPKDKSCLSLGGQQIGGKEKGDGSQSSQKHVSQKAQITPASRPSEKIHGGGWAGCGWCCARVQVILDQEILRLLVIAVLSSVEWVRTGTLVGNCELTGLVGRGGAHQSPPPLSTSHTAHSTFIHHRSCN